MSFVLSETGQIKKIDFLDVVFENQRADSRDDAFDGNAAIATGELAQLIPDLIDALGGEMTLGDAQAVPGAAAAAPSTAPH